MMGLLALAVSGCAGSGDQPSAAGELPSSDHVHALRATDDGGLLLGLHGALWQSPDGRSWEQLGLEGQDAMALGVAQDGAPLLVGGHDVLARSTDGGRTFEMLSPADLPSLDVHALAQAPSEPSTVYAFVVGAGVFRSTDGGDNWTPAAPVGEDLPGDLVAMAVDPRDRDVVLVGSPGHGVLRSTDGAASFQQTTDVGTIGLAFAGDGTVIAATDRGVEVSTDGGRTWDNAAPASDFDGRPLGVAIADDGGWWMITEQPRVLYRSAGAGSRFEELTRA